MPYGKTGEGQQFYAAPKPDVDDKDKKEVREGGGYERIHFTVLPLGPASSNPDEARTISICNETIGEPGKKGDPIGTIWVNKNGDIDRIFTKETHKGEFQFSSDEEIGNAWSSLPDEEKHKLIEGHMEGYTTMHELREEKYRINMGSSQPEQKEE